MARPSIRKPVILVSSAVALFYLVYRAVWTLNLTSGYAVFASLFLYIGELYGVITMLLYFLQVWDTTEPPEQPVLEGRTVDVFVPTYNEDPDLLRVTLQACVAMDYPHKTYLCDDGGTDARINDPQKGPAAAERAALLKAICAEVGAIYSTRPKNEHAKAGNLNYAFARTDGEFILIFDADHVPDRNFITRLLGYFSDEKLAFVQTPHAFYNFDSFQARWNHDRKQYWEEGQLFYHVIQPGRNYWNAPIFAGSAAMFRRKALAEVGYIAMETITEDMHTGLRMHSRGWKSLGISTRMISGQAAQDVTTFHSQRLRWGEGNLSVLAYDNPLTTRGLGWGQKLCYLATMINWCGGLFKLPIYLTPLLMLFSGIPPVKEFTWVLAVIMSAYMAVSILGTKFVSNGYGSIWYSELFMMASFWTQVRGTMRAAFLRKLQQFVVTAKRGRQSNSIWPFIRPQAYLIAASVAALLWAWGRIWLGISDDYFKPVLATFWTLFHMLLAYLVIRRALWPDDKRYATRHIVHLPVGYSTAGEEETEKLGVSVDLNERGLGFVAFERLEKGATLRLTLHAPSESVTVDGEIRWCSQLAGGPGVAGYRCGVQFKDLDAASTDALYRICLHYAVPRLYAHYAQGHRRLIDVIAQRLATPFLRRRFAPRREYHLPLFLETPGGVVPAVTEDISRTSVSVLLHEGIPAGMELGVSLYTPSGRQEGLARVSRCRPRVFAARTYWLCALEFKHFDGAGWQVVQGMCSPASARKLRPLLQPGRQPRPVPMNRPLAAAVLLLVPLAGLEFGLFRWNYRDDFFLQGLAAGNPATPDDLARLDHVVKDTLHQTYPPTDRLVLLSRVLLRADRSAELAEVVKRLAPRDRDNLDLQLALAYAHEQHEEYDQAEVEYQRLLDSAERGRFPEARREELLVGAARGAVHAGQLDLASERFERVLQTWPGKPAYRNEFAGALLGAGRLEEAARLLDGAEPDREGRVLKVMVHTARRRYEDAEREARALLQQYPGDTIAEGLLADVLNVRGHHLQAQAIYQRLLGRGGDDLKILLQLAHGALWARNYQDALERLQAILDQNLGNPALARQHPEVFRAYVNAAASAPRVGSAQRKTAQALFEQALADPETDVLFLTRLAWVLHRLDDDDRGAALLERAAATQPTDPGLCRQIAAGFLAANRPESARKLLEGRGQDLEARLLLADCYVQNRDFPAAITICRALLVDYPGNAQARARLADILSWNKEYKESQKIFEELAAQDPSNSSYAVRLAEVALWSGDATRALERYEALLRKDFRQPALWVGFVDAAAASPHLDPAQITLAQAVRDAAADGEHRTTAALEALRRDNHEWDEVPFLTRLAWVVIEHLKDPQQAQVLLDRAVALKPTQPDRRKELAGVLAAARRFREALKMYEGLSLGPGDRLQLARIHAGAEDFAAALEQCQQALKLQPLWKDAQVLLADVLSWQQQFSAALEMFGRLRRVYPNDDYLRRRQAEVLLWSGNVAEALELFEALLTARFDQPAVWRGFMDAAARSETLSAGQKKLARRIVDHPIPDTTVNVEFLARTAWVLHQHLDDKARAGSLLLRAVLLNSTDPAVLARLARVLHQVGDRDNRERVLKRALALRPRSPAACKELAWVLTTSGHVAEAKALFEDLARAEPRSPDWPIALAELALGTSSWTAALERLQSVEAAGRSPQWRRLFVDAAASAGTLNEAQTRLLLQIVEEPVVGVDAAEQAMYLSRLSWVLLRESGRQRAPALRQQAIPLLDRAAALRPEDPKVRRELAGVLVTAGRTESALRLFEGLTLTREDRQQLMVLHAAARQFAQAEQHCRAILQETPGDEKAREWLAHLALWSTHYAEALQRYQALLAADPDREALWSGYIETASLAESLTPEQVGLATTILDRVGATSRTGGAASTTEGLPPGTSAVFLARLALVLQRHVELPAQLPGLGGRILGLTAMPMAAGPLAAATTLAAEQARPSRAHDLLLRAIRQRPHDPTELARLAWVVYQAGFGFHAARLLDEAIAMHPVEPAVRRELGDVLVATGRLKEALRWFEDLVGTAPANREFRIRLAEVTVWASEYALGLDRIEQVLTSDLEPRSLWHSFVDGASSALSMSPSQIEIGRRLAEQPIPVTDPTARTAYLSRLSWSLFREAERRGTTADRAVINRLLGEAIRIGPRDRAVRLELAGVLTAVRRFADAQALYEGLARDFPGDVDIRMRLAEVAGWGGDHDRSLAYFEKLWQEGVRGPRVWTGMVNVASSMPALSRPQAELLAGLAEQMPGFGDSAEEVQYLSRLSWTLVREGKAADRQDWLDRAGTLLDRAVALKPASAAVRRELAGVLAAGQRLDDAETQARSLVEKDPGDREACMLLADVLSWNHKPEEAVPIYERLLRANPKDQKLARRLAEVTLWSRDYGKALDRYYQLLAGDWRQVELWSGYVDAAASARRLPAEPHRALLLKIADAATADPSRGGVALTRLGWVLRRLGEPDRSVAVLQKAVDADPNSRELRTRLAEALQAAGDYAAAERHYQYLLQTAERKP
jgi:cellulose synthase/poly-beta-1,6-N-acetylglucosamine synthase-like glycosyltransferase/tetratricopeptide (TPR) repeat protein